MLRFIVYRYIFYKDSKISHASPLALRHHLSQLPPALLPTSQPHDLPLLYYPLLYYPPHCLTTCTRPTPPSPTTHLTAPPPTPALLHPALLPTSLPHDLYLPYSTQLYYPPHSPTTCTRPTPPIPTTHLTTLLLHTTYPTTRLSIPDPIPYLCAHCSLSTPALSPATILSCTPHTRATLHTAQPISPTDVPCHLYPIGSTTQPYLGHLYPPFSSATFIGLIRPIAPIRPIPTRARTGQVVGVIGLIGAIGLIPP